MRLVSLAVVPLVLAALSAAGLVTPGTTLAQSADSDSVTTDAAGLQWFPDRWVVAALLAAPREIRLAGGLYSAERDLEYESDGTTLESEVSLGYRIPAIWRRMSATSSPRIIASGFRCPCGIDSSRAA
jgi:hypothetical protein